MQFPAINIWLDRYNPQAGIEILNLWRSGHECYVHQKQK